MLSARTGDGNRLKWPAQSPDLNPIEHLWQHLKAKLQQYDTPPKGVHELWERVAKEWNSTRDMSKANRKHASKDTNSFRGKVGSYKVLDSKILEGVSVLRD